MRRGLGVLVAVGLSACTVGGVDFTKPSAAYSLTGNYVLSLVAAADCDLPVTSFEWPVVGTAGPGYNDALVMTLPDGDRRVHLVFCGSCQADPDLVLGELDTDGPPEGDAPVPGGLKLLADLTLTGRVEADGSGRGGVSSGVAEGTLALSRESDAEADALGSCLSDVASWSLRPR
ncbi:MAG TPA: hypothetical protein VFM88_15960 [Vicinamibacteria bacterium]|nr:hypothetical protein [Vicinamibacteria bacterium]